MLQAAGLSYVDKKPSLTVDDYIPLTVEIAENRRSNFDILYWFANDEHRFLFEFGISAFDGSVISFVLIGLAQKTIDYTECVNFLQSPEKGMPFFDSVSGFDKNGHFSENLAINVTIAAGGIYIFLGPTPPTSYLQNGDLLFGLNENRCLAMVGVTHIKKNSFDKLLGLLKN